MNDECALSDLDDVRGAYTTRHELTYIAELGTHAPARRRSTERTVKLLRNYLALAETRQWSPQVEKARCIEAARRRLALLTEGERAA